MRVRVSGAVQDSRVFAADDTVLLVIWLLDLDGDESTVLRPAHLIQEWLEEWLDLCARVAETPCIE